MSQQPVPGTRSPESEAEASRFKVPYLALHPMGFSVPLSLRAGRWALTPPFHPCCQVPDLHPEPTQRSVFCGTVRRNASRRRLPRVSLRGRLAPARAGYAASCSVVFGLSSPAPQSLTGQKRFSALPKSGELYSREGARSTTHGCRCCRCCLIVPVLVLVPLDAKRISGTRTRTEGGRDSRSEGSFPYSATAKSISAV